MKKLIRKKVLMDRDNISPAEREKAAVLITERILSHQWFDSADTILAFVSFGSEIETEGILTEALKKGKRVYVPRVEGDYMNFYRINALSELQEGYKGIREPAEDAEQFVYDPGQAEKILMLMPGAVFDKNRNRIGYGKGFYDRYLCEKEALQRKTIGIGFLCQLVEELPAESWDIRPCQVICV